MYTNGVHRELKVCQNKNAFEQVTKICTKKKEDERQQHKPTI